MLKKITSTLIFILIAHLGFTQVLPEESTRAERNASRIDSLETALSNTKIPIEQFDILNQLVLDLTGWKGDNVDSTYNLKMLKIAQELKNDSLLAISYNWLGSYFYLNKGDNSTGLEYYFKAIPMAKEGGDKRRLSSLYFDIALIFFDLQDNKAALKYTRLGGNNLPDTSHRLYDFMLIQYQGNMSQYFLMEKNIDSAHYYIDKFVLTNSRLKAVEEVLGGSFAYLFQELALQGSFYALKGDEERAMEHFNQGLKYTDNVQSTVTRLLFYNNYIPFLISINQIDQAKFHSKQLFNYGNTFNNANLRLAATSFLRQIFKLQDQIDSAYYYSQMEADINRGIFSKNNLNRVQAIAFNERLTDIEIKAKEATYQSQLRQYVLLSGLGMVLIIAFLLYRNNKQKQKANSALEETLLNLKATQTQLIQAEKMASLGELTAGIAHEIQNPLNFVNNFSEVSAELAEELEDEIEEGNTEDVKEITSSLKKNLEKINHHGHRASDIVKGMLEHSRTGDGTKEPTDINKLADEYLRLSYHGLRAKDNSFNADFEAGLDETLTKINVVPQDIGRVLLNLINNAFQAVREVENPKVIITTKKTENKLVILVSDNGSGIPEDIKDKIFEPFFTTKSTGQGTGLGLSMSYDIITKGHGGGLTVENNPESGALFKIELPYN